MNTKKVEFIVSIDNLFSVVVDLPLDEDGEVDYSSEENDEVAIKKFKEELLPTIASMLNTDSIQVNIEETNEE